MAVLRIVFCAVVLRTVLAVVLRIVLAVVLGIVLAVSAVFAVIHDILPPFTLLLQLRHIGYKPISRASCTALPATFDVTKVVSAFSAPLFKQIYLCRSKYIPNKRSRIGSKIGKSRRKIPPISISITIRTRKNKTRKAIPAILPDT